jgi:hypothetical protein
MDPSHGVAVDVSPGWSVAEPWETIRDCRSEGAAESSDAEGIGIRSDRR